MTVLDLGAAVIAVVGGDDREQEIARIAAGTGAEVRAYGFAWPQAGIPGVVRCSSPEAALRGADYVLFPIPGIGVDGSLYAPDAPAPIYPTAELLGLLKPGAAIILGRADEGLRQAAAGAGLTLSEYENDTELMLLRGPAIVEGLLAVAIANTRITIHAASVGVVGYGNIGSLLARSLTALGARVHVFARNRVQQAAAYAAGCQPHALGDLAGLAPDLAMLFSTVPALVGARPVLAALPQGSLVVDVAAPPGSVDLAAARDLGHTAIWARGMGRRAPVTVGRSQWTGICRRITEHERRNANAG